MAELIPAEAATEGQDVAPEAELEALKTASTEFLSNLTPAGAVYMDFRKRYLKKTINQ